MADKAYMQHIVEEGEAFDVLVIDFIGHATFIASTRAVQILILQPSAELLDSLRQALDDCKRPMSAMTTDKEE